ncbi:unnamed protein product [Discula destructiva]
MKYVYSALGLAATALAATSRTTAPSGCSTVSPSGDGDYTTVQDAVDAAAEGDCIFLAEGTYSEQVYVTTEALTMYGYTDDTASYAGNKATITDGLSQDDGLDDDGTGTLRVHAADFRLYNVNVVNSRGSGSQAIALSAYADSGYYGCSFQGFQDTVLTEEGSQLYAGCEIVGATDFIFGQKSMAWFEGCDLRVLEASLGYLTANGASSDEASIYVFNNCDVAADSGADVSSGAYYLGRPWAEYAYVVFQSSTISDVINAAGWAAWSSSEPNTDHVTFATYDNSGDGASDAYSASFATTLSSALEIGDVLGSDYASAAWYDAAYM